MAAFSLEFVVLIIVVAIARRFALFNYRNARNLAVVVSRLRRIGFFRRNLKRRFAYNFATFWLRVFCRIMFERNFWQWELPRIYVTLSP